MKSNYMWFRGSISLIINPFLRVFSVSGFLKVIHALQTPQKRCESGTSKINFLHSVLQILAIRTCHGPYKYPHAKGWLSKWWKSWEKKIWKKIFWDFFFQNFFFKIFSKTFNFILNRDRDSLKTYLVSKVQKPNVFRFYLPFVS